jgi:hypothetical protein
MWIVAFSTLPYCPRWSVSYQWRVFHPMHCGTHCACKPPRREFLCRPVNSRPINSRPIPNVPQGLRTAFGPKTRHRHVLPCCWSSLAERSSSFIRPTGVVVISQGRWGFTAAFCVFGSGWLTVIERLIMSHYPSQLVIILMLFCRMAFSTFTFSFSAVRGCLAKLPFNTMAQRSLPVGFAQTIRTFPTSLLSTGTISSV